VSPGRALDLDQSPCHELSKPRLNCATHQSGFGCNRGNRRTRLGTIILRVIGEGQEDEFSRGVFDLESPNEDGGAKAHGVTR
jgi:hypothetical protein